MLVLEDFLATISTAIRGDLFIGPPKPLETKGIFKCFTKGAHLLLQQVTAAFWPRLFRGKGIAEFLQKPFTMQDLAAAVERALSQSQS